MKIEIIEVVADVIEVENDSAADIIELRFQSAAEVIEVGDVSISFAGGDKNYVHDQQVASVHWIINHSLNKYPSITIIDSGGNVNLATHQYVSADRVDIFFSALTSGQAYLN